jgi:hypothetical protein
MSVTPTIIRHVSGQFDSATVFLSSLNGFSGVVTLSVPGEIRTYSLNSIVLGGGATASVTITFFDDAVPAGIFTEVILGRSALIVHSVSITIISRPTLICVAPDGASSCDETPSLISGPSTPTSQLRVAVVLDGAPPNAFNAFEITLLSNHTILKPAGFDLTGSILQNPRPVFVDCIGGLSKNGGRCASTDTTDTIHVGTVGDLTQGFPGLLFTAIYNVTGSAHFTPISFQTGCAPTFPASVPPDVCVAIANGSLNSVPESIQSAGFSNLPFFGLSANPSLLSIQQGMSDFSTLTLSSVNRFSGNVTISTQLSSSGPLADLAPASLLLTPDFPNQLSFLTLTVGNRVPPGNYDIAIAATSGVYSQSIILRLTVPKPDFIMSAITDGSIVNAGDLTTSFIVLASVAGFADTVSLSLVASQSFNANLNPTSATLSVGGAVESTLVATPMAQGTLRANITATSGRIVHTVTVLVNVAGFSLVSLDYPALTMLEGSTRKIFVDIVTSGLLFGVGAFRGNVTVTESAVPSAGLSVRCSPETFVLNKTTTGGTAFCAMLSSKAGNYTLTITGTSRFLTNSLRLRVYVVHSQPILVQLHWKHHLSLSKADDTVVFVAGVYNPNKSATIFAIARIIVADPMLPSFFASAHSELIVLPPLSSRLNIPLSVVLKPPETGQLTFTVEIDWWSGETTMPQFLVGNAAASDISNTGTFTVAP